RINASTGREREYELQPAETAKKVVVVGSGPAGMEAARVAALRGHTVTLLEKEHILGGSLNLAAVVKGREHEDMTKIVDYLTLQMKKVGVEVKPGTKATKETVAALRPDAVVVAGGGTHNIPQIPGIDSKKVMTGEQLHHQLKSYLRFTGAKLMAKLVKLYLPVGKRVVIIGGTIQGCETAEMLVKRGRQVTIVETGAEIGEGMLWRLVKPQLLHWLEDHRVPMLAGVKLEEITDQGLVITSKEGEKRVLEADTIITALPLSPNTELCDELKDVAPEVHCIGDSDEPGLVVDAVAAGAAAARTI
ncbi:MAG: FAD-dependent oxidoreductase, partial [Thermoleophilia bacterium]|nr:FAD-dependent oxidoreductase [Thermoleophilia bacterium]